ncbi:MAG: carboxypeptidase regulatory-like domain-containing protein [Acidobacteriaceae bacterium]|nr:carboxypeptidase regulatory-like domain-containing protein [Acidobacteriaceae bacterium]
MKMLMVGIGLIGVLSAATMGLGQGTHAPAPASATQPQAASAYVDENTNTPAPLKMRELAGRVRDLGGTGIPRASISLFAEDGHALIATVLSDRSGEFRFGKIDKGLYRVVVRVEGLCPANIPVNLESSLLAKHKLEITMQAKGLDTCSYGVAK